MKRLLVLSLAVGVGVVLGRVFDGVPGMAEAGDGKGASKARCAGENGDVNADGRVDISDGVTILSHLFRGEPVDLVPLCGTPGGAAGLPDTGQTTCQDEAGNVVDCTSDTCPGQDGAYPTGCPSEGRFVDNQDGTVTDNCTGLMWQKDTGNDGNGLDWCAALTYCENLELAGHDDWRLPNVRELQSIVDYGRFDPAISPVFGALSSFYWSSTSLEGASGIAWIVRFSIGFVLPGSDIVLEESDPHVRAVRTGP
jgi:hypothetical protein